MCKEFGRVSKKLVRLILAIAISNFEQSGSQSAVAISTSHYMQLEDWWIPLDVFQQKQD